MIYTVRPGHTLVLNGLTYISGQQVDLSLEQAEIHKHKVEGTASNVLPLNLGSGLLSFDDTQSQLGASNYQDAIATLDSRLDNAETNFAALAVSNANTVKGRLSTNGTVTDLSKQQLKTLLDLGQGYYKGVAPYPFGPVIGDIWVELDSNNLVVERWFWNGNYWLSCQIFEEENYVSGSTTINQNFLINYYQSNFYLVGIFSFYTVSTGQLSNRYWTRNLDRINQAGTVNLGLLGDNNSWTTFNQNILNSATYYHNYQPLNLHVNAQSLAPFWFRVAYIPTGSPGNITGSSIVAYRKVKISV
jgi:hypothetical protein